MVPEWRIEINKSATFSPDAGLKLWRNDFSERRIEIGAMMSPNVRLKSGATISPNAGLKSGATDSIEATPLQCFNEP
jgi:hypothetical protein